MEAPQRLLPLAKPGWTILSFLNPIGAFLSLVPKTSLARAPIRVEHDVPVEDTETLQDPDSPRDWSASNFVNFYEDLQALRHQMGLLSNQTLDLSTFVDFYQDLQRVRHQLGLIPNQTQEYEALVSEMNSLMENATLNHKLVVHLRPAAVQPSPIMNFLYLWIIIIIVCIGILGFIVIYKEAPHYLEKFQSSLKHLKGPTTKGKDMKQDLTRAI